MVRDFAVDFHRLEVDVSSLQQQVDFKLGAWLYACLPICLNPPVALMQVREGDLTIVMQDFEEGIRKPLSHVVDGSLLRTILIQV